MKTRLIVIALILISVCRLMGAAPIEPKTPDSFYSHGTGMSMYPTFQPDEYLKLEKVPFETLKAGDIVAYWNVWAGQIACHRIERKGFSGGFVMKGDGNSQKDIGLLTIRNYHGKVVKDFGSGEKGKYLYSLDILNHSGIVFAASK